MMLYFFIFKKSLELGSFISCKKQLSGMDNLSMQVGYFTAPKGNPPIFRGDYRIVQFFFQITLVSLTLWIKPGQYSGLDISAACWVAGCLCSQRYNDVWNWFNSIAFSKN